MLDFKSRLSPDSPEPQAPKVLGLPTAAGNGYPKVGWGLGSGSETLLGQKVGGGSGVPDPKLKTWPVWRS